MSKTTAVVWPKIHGETEQRSPELAKEGKYFCDLTKKTKTQTWEGEASS